MENKYPLQFLVSAVILWSTSLTTTASEFFNNEVTYITLLFPNNFKELAKPPFHNQSWFWSAETKLIFNYQSPKNSIWKLSWLLQNCCLFMLAKSKQIDDAYEASNKKPLLTKYKCKKKIQFERDYLGKVLSLCKWVWNRSCISTLTMILRSLSCNGIKRTLWSQRQIMKIKWNDQK